MRSRSNKRTPGKGGVPSLSHAECARPTFLSSVVKCAMRRDTFLALLTIVFLVCGCSLPHRSEQHIRASLLTRTPTGTRYPDVLALVKQQGWLENEVGSGFRMRPTPGAEEVEVGTKCIMSYLGHYRGFPWRMDVRCYYAFDRDDRLLDIFVIKYADAL